MAHVEWDPALATGTEQVDEQHKRLFKLLDDLQTAVDIHGDEATEAVTDAVYELTEYVVEHFTDEQALMAERGYPSLNAHTAMHERLTSETMRITMRLFNSEDVDPAGLVTFLDNWLRTHIREQDFRFAEFCRSAERGTTD